MKSAFIETLRCLDCGQSDWNLRVDEENEREIRKGEVICRGCSRSYPVEDGILNALSENLPAEVAHEKEHSESFGYITAEDGQNYPINPENIRKFRDVLLTLPTGDDRHYFQPGGSFDNQAGNAERFFKTLDLLNLKGSESILEVGASFGWGCRHMAKRGCKVTALDVTNYLTAADLYFEEDGCYYDRLMSDMSVLPFKDQTFDVIFSHSVIHHCKDLDKLFAEFLRVLRPGGRVVALQECAFGLLEDKSGQALQQAIEEGFNENAYTLPQWKRGAIDGGFKKVDMHFFSFIDDYVFRKTQRKSRETGKLKAARWIQKHPLIHSIVNGFSIPFRVLFRPKSWMMTAYKA